jgi:hypothetical protein
MRVPDSMRGNDAAMFVGQFELEELDEPVTLRSSEFPTPMPPSHVTVPVEALVGLHDVPSITSMPPVDDDSLKGLVLDHIDGDATVAQIADAACVAVEVVRAVVAELQDQGRLTIRRAPTDSDVRMITGLGVSDETMIMEMQMHLRQKA